MPAVTKMKIRGRLRTKVLDDDSPGWARIAGTMRALPHRFQVDGELEEPPCVVHLIVSVDRETGLPAVDVLLLQRTGDQLHPGPALTGSTTRRLVLDALLRDAVKAVAEPIVSIKREGLAGVFQLLRDAEAGSDVAYGGRPTQRPRMRRSERQPITDELLRQVATVYRAARRAPTQAVADELHVSRSHAGRLVAQARAADYLGATTPGRAGEQGGPSNA